MMISRLYNPVSLGVRKYALVAFVRLLALLFVCSVLAYVGTRIAENLVGGSLSFTVYLVLAVALLATVCALWFVSLLRDRFYFNRSAEVAPSMFRAIADDWGILGFAVAFKRARHTSKFNSRKLAFLGIFWLSVVILASITGVALNIAFGWDLSFGLEVQNVIYALVYVWLLSLLMLQQHRAKINQ